MHDGLIFRLQMKRVLTLSEPKLWSEPMDNLLTLKEVAAALRVTTVGARRWLKDGMIPAFKVGKDWRIKESDLVAFLEGQRWTPAQPAATDTAQDKED